jgi:hypothetical protein
MTSTFTITIPWLAVWGVLALAYLAYSVAGIWHDMEFLPSEFRFWRREGKVFPFRRQIKRFRPGWRWAFLPAIVVSYWLAWWIDRRRGEE